MSSGFVSGGTTDNPVQRDDEWLVAQKEIEANRRRKEEESRQQDGKTLYEVLQNNKAAKQEAFEESIKLKNQFRNLDEDEVDFLDSILESTRAKEDAVKKETTEQLEAFRKQQEDADKALREGDDGKEIEEAGSPTGGDSNWAVGNKKRKRVKEKESLKGVKFRKASSSIHNGTGSQKDSSSPPLIKPTSTFPVNTELKSDVISVPTPLNTTTQAQFPSTAIKDIPEFEKPSAGLGLSGYSSDEDD